MSNERWITSAACAAVLLGVTVLAATRHGASVPEVITDYSVDGPGLNVDDSCFWTDPVDPAQSLLFVTTKDSGLVEVWKAATGAFVATIPGFARPNNCAVDGNLLLTTDADAPDVKVHHLPDLALARTFGADMIQPQGIDVLHTPAGQALVYVTDSGDASTHVYDLPTGALVRSFPTGFGLAIEPVVVDDRYQRVFLSREEGGGHGIGLFTPEGTLVKEFGAHLFPKDTEGLAIYQCGDGGYLIASDQQTAKSQFEVFDRVTLTHLGTFTMRSPSGDPTSATDGIDILQTPLPGFPNGIFSACDGCGSNLPDEMDVVSWDKIADALGLDLCPNKIAPDCITTPCHERVLANADASISSVTPTVNAGSAPDLAIDGSPPAETLLRFDVPDLTGFDVLDASVRLTVDTQSGSGSASGGMLYAASGAWDEATVTWDTRPAAVGTVIDTVGPVAPAEVVDFDVRGALRDGIVNDFVLRSSSGDRALYRSREANNSPPALLLSLHASAAPTLSITTPASGAVVPAGVPVTLTASASDVEDGDLGGHVGWRSDHDGVLGSGATITPTLSDGPHLVTADVVDGAGLHASATITLTVDAAPAVTISSPAPGTSVSGGTALTLAGSAVDVHGADLSSALAWTSSRDGSLGVGASISVVLTEGTHILTAAAKDTGGAVGSAQRTVTVTAAPPTLTIDDPADGTTIVSDQPLLLAASAHDFTDGDLAAHVTWSSDLQGALGNGAPFTAVGLVLGIHVITARVVDSSGLEAQTSIHLRVAPATMTFTAVADAYVVSKSPSGHFGTATTLQADASPVNQIFLRFAVSGLSGLRVVHAALRLTVGTGSGADSAGGGTVHAITDTGWDEATLTYASRPPIDGPALASQGAVAKNQLVEFDVSGAVTADGNMTFALVGNSSDAVKYKSREATNGRPKLVLTLRPTSGTAAPPIVTITSPADGTVVRSGTPLTLRANATDFEDGDLSSAVVWTSDIAGALGTGSPLDVPALAPGTHTIKARVLDTTGQAGTAAVHVVVTPAGTLILAPVADTYVAADVPTKSYGAASTMTADSSPVRIMLLRFVVSGLAGRHVDGATLRLTVGAAAAAASVKGGAVHAITDTGWSETTVTYDTRPAIDGPVLASAGAVAVGHPVDFDVTPAISGDGIVVFALDSKSSDGVSYVTREGGAGAPQLLLATSPGAALTITEGRAGAP